MKIVENKNMKILLIQENGRHKENREFRECFSLQKSFNKLGHEATVWGLGHDNFNETPLWEEYDWIINLENYDSGWVPSLSNVKLPIKFLWSIDAHFRGEEVYEEAFKKGKYTYMLHSAQHLVKKDYHIWFPNCFDDNLIKPLNIDKKYNFGFCGNYVNRAQILNWLRETQQLHLDIFVIGESMVKSINSYSCHFNYNMDFKKSPAINYRNFETIGCGTLLLTSQSSEYEKLGFKDGVNCFIYNSIDEIVEKMNYIKNNDTTEIAKNGLLLSKTHTYDNRVIELIKKLQ